MKLKRYYPIYLTNDHVVLMPKKVCFCGRHVVSAFTACDHQGVVA